MKRDHVLVLAAKFPTWTLSSPEQQRSQRKAMSAAAGDDKDKAVSEVAVGGEQPAPPAPKAPKPKDTSTSVQDKAKLLEESKQRSLDVIAGAQSLLIVVILGLAYIVAFSSRLFAVIRFESIIHEFDPW